MLDVVGARERPSQQEQINAGEDSFSAHPWFHIIVALASSAGSDRRVQARGARLVSVLEKPKGSPACLTRCALMVDY